MSNFYLDIIKDRLYCGAEAERRSAQTALYHILDGMTRLIAPILAFTSDEIWHAMKHAQGVNAESVLFNDMPGDNAAFALDAAARERWAKLVSLRDAVNKALENARNAGVFKKAQDTDVTLSVSESDAAFLAGVDLASLCIVSKVTVTTGAVEGEERGLPHPLHHRRRPGRVPQVPPLLEPQRAHRRRRPPQPAVRPLRRRGG